MSEATGLAEPIRMSPTYGYERDAAQHYLAAIRALHSGDIEQQIDLIPKVFPVRPLVLPPPQGNSIFSGVIPYEGTGTPADRRKFGRLMTPKEYVETLKRIQEDGMKSPDRDLQLFSDRNIRGLYFVNRPEVAWGLLYIEVPLHSNQPFVLTINTTEGPKPVFRGIMRGMTFVHGDEFIVYTLGEKPLTGEFKIGLKPHKDVHEKLPTGYYAELQKEFRKTFANEVNSSS